MPSDIVEGDQRTDHNDSEQTSLPTYPYATSPDIIRSNQKDLHLISSLQTQLSELLRRTFGSRFSHKYVGEIETGTSLIYYALTTLIGNRTLGEEYTDIYQVETDDRWSQRLPSIGRRAGYIVSSILLPYAATRALPSIRARLRSRLEKNLAHTEGQESLNRRIQSHILNNLSSITSLAPIYALTLTSFYFTGTYYHLSKRIYNLRYVFSRRLSKFELEQRSGYEVLGLLLVLQIIAQAIMQTQSVMKGVTDSSQDRAVLAKGTEEETNNEQQMLIGEKLGNISQLDSRSRAAIATHTPLIRADEARYDLSEPTKMAWLPSEQHRKCTLCLEPMKDPSVTTCGHVFCWTCILDWIMEKPECPLCRQSILSQHVLPLRG